MSTAPAPSAARRRSRSVLGWAGVGAGLLVAGIAVAAIAGINTMPAQGLLDPEAAGPEGSRALAELLRDGGVEVEIARDRSAALRALDGSDATLAIADTAPLDDDDLVGLRDAASGVVLLEPRTRDLRLLLGAPRSAGFADGATVEPDCDLPAAAVSGPVGPGEVFTADGADHACYPAAAGYGLVASGEGADRVVALDATALLVNQRLADDGNAALGLNLLGSRDTVVWYLPSIGDGSLTGTPSLGELTPPWVTPAILLLLGSAVAAGIWRGRRFGPLVAENLPVTVRASETTEGRARLYAASADPVHALDQLRRETLRRISRALGLGSADAGAVADAAASRIGDDRTRVRGILIDDLPRNDRDLVDAADRLRDVEAAVLRSVRPERNTP
ncbi:hypothetical protein QE367_001323 [Microbacterium paludicola]|uniref:DUF4350 domain-containing protein n=1 Tax=Microbacterium paludicola TaxID=300019 RepID=A0ABU1I2D3_9MICO|nr:DUF4350 domain-containing protein [Microbacterium paludicola]MDR6167119.1 hypothetical protein [Microbacterium paludicola]